MNNSPKPLAEVCKEIGARIEDYTGSTSGPHGTPYQHSQYAGGKVVTVIYPLPNDFDRTFGPLGVSDARIVGVACGPIVYMEMLTPTPQPEQEHQETAAAIEDDERESGKWLPSKYSNGHSRKVGTLELLRTETFLQYGSNAADTDWVTCQPQIADIMQHGDDYWVCASFEGVLTQTTRTYQATLGQPEKAHMQTQSFGGIGHWLDDASVRVTITHPDLSIQQVGKYDDGKPILALRKA